MINKRGLSEVVATVMIVLLVIVAISIIAAFVVPFVRNSLQKSTECINYRDYFSFDETFGLNCYQGNLAGVSIKAAGDNDAAADVKGFKLVAASRDGTSKGANVQKVVYGDLSGDGIFLSGDLSLMAPIVFGTVKPAPGSDLFMKIDVNGDGTITLDANPNSGSDFGLLQYKLLQTPVEAYRFPIETMAGHVRMLGVNGTVEIPAGGETISYVYTSAGGDLSSASIYPILKSGRVCSEGDTVQLSPCGAGINIG